MPEDHIIALRAQTQTNRVGEAPTLDGSRGVALLPKGRPSEQFSAISLTTTPFREGVRRLLLDHCRFPGLDDDGTVLALRVAWPPDGNRATSGQHIQKMVGLDELLSFLR